MGDKVFPLTQNKFSSADSWKHTGLYKWINTPIDCGGFYIGFNLIVEFQNIFAAESAFAFKTFLKFSDI